MKSIKKCEKRFYFCTLIISGLIISSGGCVNPVDGPPPDQLAPSINIYSPLSNDTIHIGQNQIFYEASDDYGLSYYELYVNDSLITTFEKETDKDSPEIFLSIKQDMLNQIISYYLNVYDLSGNKSSSGYMRNILVDDLRLPPAAPANLVLNKLNNKIYNLMWSDESEDELQFEIWRSEDTSAFKLVQILPFNSISTNDTIQFPNLTYSYIVKASNSHGKSGSNVVTTNPDFSGLIHAPSNLEAIAYGTSRIKLSWKDNSDNELAFKVERKISSSNDFEEIAFAGANETIYYNTENLFPTTEYTYRIAAVGQFGVSTWSNSVTVATLAHDLNPPNNLQVLYDSTDNVVTLRWDDNSIFDIETRIERSGISKIFTEIGTAGANIKTYSDSTVSSGQTYFYKIRSYTVGGFFTEYTEEVEIKL